jgi:hypothetical protein
MATVTAPQPTVSQVQPTSATGKAINRERFDIAYGFQTEVDKDGNVVKDKNGNPKKDAVTLDPKKAEELSDKGQFEGSVITVSCDYPTTLDDLIALANTPAVDDEGKPRDQNEIRNEIVKLFKNGANSKVMNRMRATLTKVDDKGNLVFNEEKDAPGSVLDLTSEITSGSRRVFLTEEQKMWKGLVFLPQQQKENVWRAYLTGIGKDFYLPAE